MGAKNMTREARDMELQWFDIRELTEDAAQTVIGMMDETRRRRVADIAGEDDRKPVSYTHLTLPTNSLV